MGDGDFTSYTFTCAANPTCDNTDGGNTAFGQSDCDAGFTIKSTLAGVNCGSDTCVTSDCCDINSCTATEVANSNKNTIGAITGNTGDTTLVTCDTGYAGTPTFTATCGTSGTFNAITCTAEACTAANVANSDKASGTADITGSTGDAVTITCDAGYSGSGASFPTATCGTGGMFNVLICAANSCTSTQIENSDKSTANAIAGTTGSTFEVTCNEKFMGGGVATCGTDGNFNDVLCAATLNGVLKQSLTFEGVSKEQIDNLEKKKRIEASIATYLKIDKESVKITSIKESASSSSGIEIKYEVSGQNSGTADNALVTTRMSAMKTATNVVSAVAEEGGVSIANVRIASVSKTTVEKAPSPSASPSASPGSSGSPSASPGSSGSTKSSRISPMNIMFIILAVVVVCFAMYACCHHKKLNESKSAMNHTNRRKEKQKAFTHDIELQENPMKKNTPE